MAKTSRGGSKQGATTIPSEESSARHELDIRICCLFSRAWILEVSHAVNGELLSRDLVPRGKLKNWLWYDECKRCCYVVS